MNKTVLTSVTILCLLFTVPTVGYNTSAKGSFEQKVHYSNTEFMEDSIYEQNLSSAADFLNNTQFNPAVGLCRVSPSYFHDIYFLVNDNLLAYHALKYYYPEIAETIYNTMKNYGYFRSYKIDTVFGTTVPYIPFKDPTHIIIDQIGNATIKTEVCNGTEVSNFKLWADLCIFAALHYHWIGNGSEAVELFNIAKHMWDGKGLADQAFEDIGTYSTFKLALLLYASRILNQPLENKTSIEETLWLMQDKSDGGLYTDYDINLNPVGDMNTETTSLAILAYKYEPKVVNRPKQHPFSLDIPPDYQRIQEAINPATEGDTIFVYNGTYYEHVVVNKSISLIGENPITTIIDGGETGNVVCLRANNIKISGFTIQNSGTLDWDSGVYVSRSSGNNISFNIVTNNKNGIFIHKSSKNTLTNNIVNANWLHGVHLWDTSNDALTDNTVSNNYDGIIMELCSNTILRNNTASGNMYNFGVGGVELSHFVHDIDASNKVEGKSIQYLVDRKDMVIDSSWDVGYLCLVNSTNVTVKDLTLTVRNWHGIKFAYTKNSRIENVTISRTSYAIDFSYSSNNTVINNNILNQMGIRLHDSNGNAIINNSISNTWHAISFYSSNNNTITNNYINNNRYGIWSYDSSDNKIYHNNFVENIQQAYDSSIECPEYPLSINIWDDGYPSGGNYWSDYTGVDLYMGHYQNETGSDGIGDTPYISDENNQDNYPLMNPYRSDTEEMRILYYELLEKYNELSSRHHELLDSYSKLLSDFGALNATFYGLLADYDNLQVAHDSLNSTYNNLVSDYDNLQSSYNQLDSSYTALQDSYNELQSDREAITNELSTTRNQMYTFIATTIILTATTVYFMKRKARGAKKNKK